MIIKIDSRERKKLVFTHPWVEAVRVRKLDVGDYMCVYRNLETCNISFDRKSKSDIFGTLNAGYPRFKREIERAQASGILLWIIIEKPFTDILKGHIVRRKNPHTKQYEQIKQSGTKVVRTLMTLYWQYGVMHTYCRNREEMASFIENVFIWYGLKKLSKKN